MRILDLNATQCQVAERLRALHVDRIKDLLGLQRWKKKNGVAVRAPARLFFIFQVSRTPCFKAFWVMRSQAAFDLAPVKDAFLRGCTGTVYGDKGYIGRDAHCELMKQNLLFSTHYRSSLPIALVMG